jgi:GT2 family glycosyltransferase
VGNPDQARWAPPGEYFTTRTTLCFIAVVIPRRVWDEAGPMDERFTAYGCDDADAGRRVVEAGYQLGVMGWLAVRHGIPEEGIAAHGTYRQRYKLAEHARLGQEALRIFADKWGGGPQLGAYAQMIDP